MWRYQVVKLAERFGKLPEEIEDMDARWFYDALLFAATERVARMVKSHG